MSQITTHVLDTMVGKPAVGVSIILEQKTSGNWQKIAEGLTDSNGRISNFLSSEKILEPSTYRMIFNTQSYFTRQNINPFYPQVVIEFETTDTSHYHIPLLLSPYGYSTYRGS